MAAVVQACRLVLCSIENSTQDRQSSGEDSVDSELLSLDEAGCRFVARLAPRKADLGTTDGAKGHGPGKGRPSPRRSPFTAKHFALNIHRFVFILGVLCTSCISSTSLQWTK